MPDPSTDDVLAIIRARGLGLVCVQTKDGLRWGATKVNQNAIQGLSGSTYLGTAMFEDPAVAIAEAEKAISDGELRAAERSHNAMVDSLSGGEYVPWPETDGTWSILRTADEATMADGFPGVREALLAIGYMRSDPSGLQDLKPIKTTRQKSSSRK